MIDNPDALRASLNDRKLGLEYAWRTHPAETPAAEEHGQEQPFLQNIPNDDMPTLGSADAAQAMIKHLKAAIASTSEQHFRTQVTAAGYKLIRPRIVVTHIANICDNGIEVVLVEGENQLGPAALRIVLSKGTPCPLMDVFFARAFCVKYLSSTDGGSAAATATVGGTWNTGQVYSFNFTFPNKNDITNPLAWYNVAISYTTVPGDANNTQVALMLSNLLNTAINALESSAYTSAASTNTFTVTAANPGSIWGSGIFSNATASGAGTLTFTPFSGYAVPQISISGRSI